MKRKPCIAVIAALLLLCAMTSGVLAKPLIVTSIHPLALLAAEVVGDDADIVELLPVGELPHQYALHLSQRQLLAKADLILWVGPDMERFLAKAIAAEPAAKVIEAAKLPGISFPDNGGEGHRRDYHIWLNPENAQKIAGAIALQLESLASVPKSVLDGRLNDLDASLKSTVKALEQQFIALPNRRFIADHDAFSHFAQRFGLQQVGALHHYSGLALGARDLAALYQQKDIACVAVEPRYQQARVNAIAEKLTASLEVVDPLGADIGVFEKGYVTLITQVGEAFVRCLTPQGRGQ